MTNSYREDTGEKTTFEPLAFSLNDTAAKLGVSRSHLYVLHSRGKLRFVKLGNKTLVSRAEILRLLSESEAA